MSRTTDKVIELSQMENVSIADKMNRSTEKPPIKLYKALLKFQKDFPIIYKTTKAYNYDYADLGTVIETIMPILHKHGLMFLQPLNGDVLSTQIIHVDSGEMQESFCTIPVEELRGQNIHQSMGSAITYHRRYSLASHLGLITDKDTDGIVPSAKKETPKAKIVTSKTVKKEKKKLTQEQYKIVLESIKTNPKLKNGALEAYDLTKTQINEINSLKTIVK